MRFFLRLSLLLLLTALACLAQSTFGEIRGLLKDSSGASVGKATIKATRPESGESRTTSTDESGNFVFANLIAGEWQVLIEKQGFRPSLVKGIILRAREVVRTDVSLELSQVSTEIKVEAESQVVQTDMATIMDSKSADALTKLPVNYRAGGTNTFYSIISTAPGVQPDASGNYSVGGGMPFQSTASVDGISNINVRSNGVLTEMFPSADSVDEVRVSATNNNAEFAQAGDITVTSKSGGNKFHGQAYWYHQNGAFDARNFFAPSTPFKVSNDYGATLSGPAIKNRTFFFASFEQLRNRAQTIINTTLPPANFRAGNFSALTTALRDPFNSNAPFAGNIIPSSRISSVSTGLMTALYPNPTRSGDNVSSPNYTQQKGLQNDNDQFDIRVDHNFSTAHRIFGRYSQKDISRISPTTLFEKEGNRVSSLNPKNMVGAWNWILKPNLLNEFRFGFGTQDSISTFGINGQTFDGPGLLKSVGMQGIRSDPPAGSQVPDISINGFAGTGQGRESITRSRNVQYSDNLTWIKGRHTFKFGTDIRRLRTTDITSFTTGDDMGSYAFNGQYSGYGMADFLLGVPNSTTLANTGKDVDGVTLHYGFYLQDDYKVNSKLTLNYGVRYEIHPMFFDNALTTSQFDRAFPGGRVILANEDARKFTSPAFLASIGNTPVVLAKDIGLPERLRYTDFNNVAPRFGFAYRPFGNRTVIRGGYGIFTSTILGSVFYTISGIHVSDTRTSPTSSAPMAHLPFASHDPSVPALATSALRTSAVPPSSMEPILTLNNGTSPSSGNSPSRSACALPTPAPRLLSSLARPISIRSASTTSATLPHASAVPIPIGTSSIRAIPIPKASTTQAPPKCISVTRTAFSSNPRGSGPTPPPTPPAPTAAASLAKTAQFPPTASTSPWIKETFPAPAVTVSSPPPPMTSPSTNSSAITRRQSSSSVAGSSAASSFGQTGLYLTPTTGDVTDPSGTQLTQRATNRPDYSGTSDGNLPASDRSVNRWFDVSAFSIPGRVNGVNLPNNGNIGRFGYVGPGVIVGPRTTVLSMKLQKKFNITERLFATLEGSASNLGNTPNFGNPVLNISNSNAGRITSTQSGENAGSRSLQVMLRIGF